jgi:Archaeal ADP-dependent phosphofructokinase/glucokinase
MTKEIAAVGCTVDYELVWDSSVIENLIKEYAVYDADLKQPDELDTERKLIISILSFMKEEVGSNRSIVENVLFEFVSRMQKKTTLGGTGTRAAYALEKFDISCILHGNTQNKYTRALLPKTCEYMCSSGKDTLYPHVIIQYTSQSVIHANDIDIRPSRANRLIYSNDKASERPSFNPDFFEKRIIGVNVLHVNCFESVVDQEILHLGWKYLCTQFKNAQKRGTIVYQEMGCHHSAQTRQYVLENMYSAVDICSMNEDELGCFVGKKIDLLDAADVHNALERMHSLYPVPLIIIHSKYWALCYGKNAHKVSECLKTGITMATARFRFGDNFTVEQYNDTYDAAEEECGKKFVKDMTKIDTNVCCKSSVVVFEKNVTTVGLGDTFLGGVFLTLHRMDRDTLLK